MTFFKKKFLDFLLFVVCSKTRREKAQCPVELQLPISLLLLVDE